MLPVITTSIQMVGVANKIFLNSSLLGRIALCEYLCLSDKVPVNFMAFKHEHVDFQLRLMTTECVTLSFRPGKYSCVIAVA
jgi:hypothetical protein